MERLGNCINFYLQLIVEPQHDYQIERMILTLNIGEGLLLIEIAF